MGDPFARARRSLFIAPLMIGLGGFLVYLGIAGDGLAWLLCVVGGIVALLGLLRLLGATAVLLIEGRRKAILRDGVPSTATVLRAEPQGKKFGYPIYESDLRVAMPDGTHVTETKRGAIPPSYEGSLHAGMELPVKVRAEDRSYAVDWGVSGF